MKPLALAALVVALSTTAALAEFRLSFDWGNIPSCTSGRPNTVPNPAFVLRDVPAGTDSIEFRLRDLDAPGYNHGGGRLGISGDGTVPTGVFTYRSPCPPGGVHTYEWTATARAGRQVLAVATAQRRYPE